MGLEPLHFDKSEGSIATPPSSGAGVPVSADAPPESRVVAESGVVESAFPPESGEPASTPTVASSSGVVEDESPDDESPRLPEPVSLES